MLPSETICTVISTNLPTHGLHECRPRPPIAAPFPPAAANHALPSRSSLCTYPRQIKRQHIIGSRDQKKGRVPIQRCLERYVVQVDYSVQLRVVEKTCFGSTGQCVGAEATLAVPRERGESTRKAATRGRRGERRVTEIGNLNVRELPGISAEP